jgi:hypothetical protein
MTLSNTFKAMRSLRLAIESMFGFIALASSGALRLRRDRLRRRYVIGAQEFEVFRETISVAPDRKAADHVVLVVGFRLRLIGRLPAAHWLFQRVCVMTTPFWCGLRGFRVKLWMVDPDTKDYAGIYDWAGRADAERYVQALVPVLRAVSVSDSVWQRIEDQPFEEFLLELRGRNGRES